MALKKVTYIDETTVIEAENLNNIQDAIIALENEDKLPTATPENNGKILQIVNGAWSVEDAPSGGGGGGGGGTAVATVVDGVLVVTNSETSTASVATGPVGYMLVNGADTAVVSDDTLTIG